MCVCVCVCVGGGGGGKCIIGIGGGIVYYVMTTNEFEKALEISEIGLKKEFVT